MKYKDLPTEKIIIKLRSTSFSSPAANRDVYNWSEKILPHIRFIENERVKLIKKYGNDNGKGGIIVPREHLAEFQQDFLNILDMDIDDNIPDCPIKKDWFDDDKCQYAEEKELWISAQEMNAIFNSIEKEKAGS